MKRAFLFPGQGAQVVAMGADVAESFPVAAELYERANDVVGYDLRKVCFEGPEDQLNTTTYSQPAIFVTSAAILEVLRTELGVENFTPDVTAGLSLGEYTALYAAGLLSFEDGVKLVSRRGQAMQAASDATDGGMVSIIGLDEDKTRALCEQAGQGQLLEPVNFNCPGQIVISGAIDACKRAADIAPEHGAIKAIQLAVAGAFHTEMMASAAEALGEALASSEIGQPGDIKTMVNISGGYYESSEQIVDGLKSQLTNPILWQKCMENLLGEGVEQYYEIGPNRVLTGLMRRINRKTRVINISNAQAIKDVIAS